MAISPESSGNSIICRSADLALINLQLLVDADVADVIVTDQFVAQVLLLNTPDEILSRDEFNVPEIIRPDNIPTSKELFSNRDRIRRLELVPEKTQDVYDKYHGYAKDKSGRQARQTDLVREVEKFFTYANDFALVPNMYPHNLPLDIKEYIVWMRNMDTPRRDSARFIAQCIQKMDVPLDDLILFERSLKTAVQRVRGSFPVYRHIHMWIRK